MIMTWIWTGLVGIAIICAIVTGSGQQLAAAVMEGAQSGVTLVVAMAGAICLWSGVGKVMERIGLTAGLSRLFRPVLERLFPSCKTDPALAGSLSANICANILGLGNAATPMGVDAAKRMAKGSEKASHELCRLIVLNTASIQLIPTNVAAVRASLGCQRPFDILPAVWVTSLLSAGLGLVSAFTMGKLWRR